MAYFVDAPQVDDFTGQVVGEPQVSHRGLTARQLTVSDPNETYDEVDPNEFNDAINPAFARRALQAELPIFREDASDESIVNFWRSSEPLTEAEVDAIQAAYTATDNADIANLLMWKLTGDTNHLSDQQLFELGLDDEGDYQEAEDTSDTVDAEAVVDFIFDNADEPNDEAAQALLSVENDGSDAATVIQHLAYQYYSGQLTLDDAYDEALSSGVDHNELAAAFTQLREHFI